MPIFDPNTLEAQPSRPLPFGAHVRHGGVHFSVFSRHAERLWLGLFHDANDTEPAWTYRFEPQRDRFGDCWSVFVRGLGEGACYAYRADGPNDFAAGHHYDPGAWVIDPYARAIRGDIAANRMKGVTVRSGPLPGARPRTPMHETVIYETHVRGLTRHASAGVEQPGTYAGLIEKIPYLKDLGVTAVELLPVHECGEPELVNAHPEEDAPLSNYWGYNTLGFFAPASRFAESGDGYDAVGEFRAMADALHAAGLELYLDVVYNHTSEGNEHGYTQSFRGLDNQVYYLLTREGYYVNHSGVGNTLKTGHPVVQELILDSLRYWVIEMGVDGFRFDLASILNRDRHGNLLNDAPLIQRIADDPALQGVKMIAEAWDAGGAYQVGGFSGWRWAEWNGRYRDDVRRFWRGDSGMRGPFATRITGSSDLFNHHGRSTLNSVNFVTAHDGFTLRDQVSYTEKRNWLNGEDNRDGHDENFSINCGVEGETDNAPVNTLRVRMQRNFLGTLFLSLGVPMLLGGDEFGRTQRGNNNAYCQDNDLSWFDWTLAEKNADLVRFVRGLIRYRRANPVFARRAFFNGEAQEEGPDIRWFDERGRAPQWERARATLALWINGRENGGMPLFFMFNSLEYGVEFRVPAGTWYMHVHTGRPAPYDVIGPDTPRVATIRRRLLLPRKCLVVAGGAVRPPGMQPDEA